MRRRFFFATTAFGTAWASLSACGGDSGESTAPNEAPPATMPAPGPTSAPAPATPPSPAPGYLLNFATAAIENPLSAGGVWTNNTQGTGGNTPPLNMTSMRVALASDGATRIAMATHEGINYDDSFAFVPGFGANQWCEGVLYKEPGYNANAAGANHELEIILGCRTSTGYHRWNEFLLNSGGGMSLVSLDGGPGAFTVIGAPTGALQGRVPVDGDVFRATKTGSSLNMYINGILVYTYSGALVADGSGIGIAGFIRPGATLNKFGFRRVSMGNL
jgi:hypothetical protein